jgi:hypothetical protein
MATPPVALPNFNKERLGPRFKLVLLSNLVEHVDGVGRQHDLACERSGLARKLIARPGLRRCRATVCEP